MVSKTRAHRIAERIYEELSTLLLWEVGDPRLESIFVTKVRVDQELAYANVYVSALDGSGRETEILDGLERAGGFLRSQLANRIQLRFFPRLRFYWDPSPEHVDRIEELIAKLDQEEHNSNKDTPHESKIDE
jgi:ribosome-binding factor A